MFPFPSPPLTGTQAGGGGSGTFNPVRSTSILQVANASSQVVSWPVGATAGDNLLIFCAHGFAVTTPVGWGSLEDNEGANFNGKIVVKVLNSTDISNGSVTVTFGGAFDGVIWTVCLVGANTVPAGIGASGSYRDSTGASARTVTTPFTPSGGECVLFFGAGRLSNLTVTCDHGVLQDTLSTGTNVGAAGYKLLNVTAGSLSAIFTYSSVPVGDYGALVVIGP